MGYFLTSQSPGSICAPLLSGGLSDPVETVLSYTNCIVGLIEKNPILLLACTVGTRFASVRGHESSIKSSATVFLAGMPCGWPEPSSIFWRSSRDLLDQVIPVQGAGRGWNREEMGCCGQTRSRRGGIGSTTEHRMLSSLLGPNL